MGTPEGGCQRGKLKGRPEGDARGGDQRGGHRGRLKGEARGRLTWEVREGCQRGRLKAKPEGEAKGGSQREANWGVRGGGQHVEAQHVTYEKINKKLPTGRYTTFPLNMH